MSKVRLNGDIVSFRCPGCDHDHSLPIDGDSPSWTFNGNIHAPTLVPSILMRSGHYRSDATDCWCNYEERYGKASPFKCVQCHSFVTDGKIQFLSDCSHAKAGMTIDLPEIAA